MKKLVYNFGLGCWVCAAYDNILECRYFIVDKRDRETLLPIIMQEIEYETTIYSDEWRAYSTLKEHGFLHQTVNHSKNFIDRRAGAQTQTIECLWKHMKVKYGIRARGATNLLERQLQKEWWRSVNQKNKKNMNNC